MDVLKQLNAIAQNQHIPTKKLSELNIDQEYPIIKLKDVQTKHGKKIVAVFEDFQVFLPDRFSKLSLSDFNIAAPIKLVYRGRKTIKNYENEKYIIEFIG